MRKETALPRIYTDVTFILQLFYSLRLSAAVYLMSSIKKLYYHEKHPSVYTAGIGERL
jgi:hypothetical protein